MGGSNKMPTPPRNPYGGLQEADYGAMTNMDYISEGPNYASELFNAYGGGLAGVLGATTYNPQNAVNAGDYMMSQAPRMYGYGDALMGMGLDPQHSYYNQMFQQQQEQGRAGQAARGILTSPVGAQLEAQQNQYFNNLWQNQQAQRAAQLSGAAQGMYGQGAGQFLSGAGLGAGVTGQQMGWLSQLQNAGLMSYAQPQQAVQNYLNYLNQGGNYQQQLYQSQLAAQAQANAQGAAQSQGIGQMAGMAMMAMMMMSDGRVKCDLKRIGSTKVGIPVYEYRYLWDEPDVTRVGVVAQDVLQYKPEAVQEIDGYLYVNYGAL